MTVPSYGMQPVDQFVGLEGREIHGTAAVAFHMHRCSSFQDVWTGRVRLSLPYPFVMPVELEKTDRLEALPLGSVLLRQRLAYQGAGLDELGSGHRVVDRLPFLARTHQQPFAQDAKVLRDVVYGDAERRGELTHAPFSIPQGVHDGEPVWISHRLTHLGLHI